MEYIQPEIERPQNAPLTTTPLWSYWPLFLVYVFSLLLSFYTVRWNQHPDSMSHVMGWVLVLFGISKLFDLPGFAKGFRRYDPLAQKSSLYAQFYPLIELGLGGLFILQLLIIPATLVTLTLYSFTLYGVAKTLGRHQSPPCVCLGTFVTIPLSYVTLAETVVMIVMCLWMLLMVVTMTGMEM